MRGAIQRDVGILPAPLVLGGRIGNDLEPMLFYGDMVAQVGAAQVANGRLQSSDPAVGPSSSGHRTRRPLGGARAGSHAPTG